MTKDSFSFELLETYYDAMRSARTEEELLRKANHVLEWLEWLHKRRIISDSDFVKYKNATNKVVKQYVNDSINKNQNFFQKNKYSIFITSVILLGVVSFGLYHYFNVKNTYDSESDKIVRTLPYSGKLVDKNGQIISSKKDLTFKLYESVTSDSPLYTGTCIGERGITPDHKGEFTVVIGADCEMEEIPSTLFIQYSELYLGVQVGSEPELKPRQKVSTAGYSRDAARLDGMKVGTDTQNIPYIDESGVLNIDATDPIIRSSNGNLQIESQTLTFTTLDTEKSSIVFQPQGNGNTIIATGKFAVGTFTPVSQLSIEGVEPYGTIGSIVNLATVDDPSASVLNLETGTPADGTSTSFISFYAGSSKNNKGEMVGSIRLNNEGVAFETSGADFAEYFDTSTPDIPAGTIISISNRGVAPARPGEHIIGVVSDQAGFVGNKGNDTANQILVALVGQVYVYINGNENIVPGTRIAASFVDGIGTRVEATDFTVGIALEPSEMLPLEACPRISVEAKNRVCKKIKILLK